MKSIINKITLLFAALAVFSSCLNKTPGDYIPIDEGMASLTDAEQMVNGIYNTMKGGSLYTGALTLAPDLMADFVYAVEGNSNAYFNLWKWDVRSDDQYIESVYSGLYSVIGQCNYYLDKIGDLKAKMYDDEEIKALDALTGEVYFCRALAYSELLKCFCKAYDPATAKDELGVVLATSYFNPAPKKRASLEESYALVLEDLKNADGLLDPDDNASNAVYAKNGAVHALWARVALYMQDWKSAVEHATTVIESGDYKLADCKNYYTQTQTYLDYLWQADASYEIIFKLGFTSTSYGSALGSIFLGFTRDYYYFYPDYVPGQDFINLFNSNDRRTDTYLSEQQTGYSHQLKWPLLVKYYGNESLIALNIYHVSMPKPLRLAETYLIRSEAYCRLGEFSKASNDINTLRKNRFSNGSTVSLNEENWLQNMSDERARELVMEGFRLHDLKRWHKGFERKPQSSCVADGSSLKIEPDNVFFVWPIPRNELEAPGSEIQPNESNR